MHIDGKNEEINLLASVSEQYGSGNRTSVRVNIYIILCPVGHHRGINGSLGIRTFYGLDGPDFWGGGRAKEILSSAEFTQALGPSSFLLNEYPGPFPQG